MSCILTLVAAGRNLHDHHAEKACALTTLSGDGNKDIPAQWLAPGKALDLALDTMPPFDRIIALRAALEDDQIDVLFSTPANRRKKLLLSDMDGTIIDQETIDELAALAGVEQHISAITARAMRGEIDFADSLRARVALLEGVPVSLLDQVTQHIKLHEGAATLISTMRKAGARCVLVSGGFTFCTSFVAERAGFDDHHGNILDIQDHKLTGRVQEPILDHLAKQRLLAQELEIAGLTADDSIAIGDGANDLPMLKSAGMAIGFRPKPVILESIASCIIHGDLRAALYAQGMTTF